MRGVVEVSAAQGLWLRLALVAALGMAAYGTSLQGPFQFDDRDYVVENPAIRSMGSLVWAARTRGADLPENVALNVRTRFVGYLTFLLNYRLHGLDARGYHAVNLLIHLLNGCLVLLLVESALRSPPLRALRPAGRAGAAGMLAAALFVAHPVQTEAVTYISQRFTSLATLFYVLAVLLYLRHGLAGGRGAYLGALASAAAAAFTKEISFTLPLTLALVEMVFLEGRPERRAARLAPFFLVVLLVPLGLVDFGKPLGESLSDASRTQPLLPRWKYLLVESRVVLTYVRLLFLPVNQNLDYDIFRPGAPGAVAGAVASLVLVVGVLAAIAVSCLRQRRRAGRMGPVCFGILWFLLTLSVESSFIPLGDLIFEHRLYLPSVGACMAVSCGMVAVHGRLGRLRGAAAAAVAVLPLVLAAGTISRNQVWSSEIALWEDVVAKSPGKARDRLNLGSVYLEAGLPGKAIEEFVAGLGASPRDARLHYGLGMAYQLSGRDEEARRAYTRVLSLDPEHAAAYNNLAVIYRERGRTDEAVHLLERAVELRPENWEARYNLALAYESLGRRDDAVRELEAVRELRPDDPQVHEDLGDLYRRAGRPDASARSFRRARELGRGGDR